MENEYTNLQYFIQQNGPQDPHPAVFRMRKPVGGTWEAHYWDWGISDWHEEEDIVRQYWNGFDPDVTKASEAEAKARIADHSINHIS